jgi:adenylate cyclase
MAVRVLLVDDEVENLRALKQHLEDSEPEWIVDTAASEEEAISLASATSPDVVVCDLVMKTEQGGIQVLREVRKNDPFVMVILITAYERKLDRYGAFDLGAFDCVAKNMPGVVAANEILVKARAAVRFRALTLSELDNQKQLGRLGRYFDPTVFALVQQNPQLLAVQNRVVTVVFWDIRGFSLLSETLKAYPTLIASFLTEYLDAAAQTTFFIEESWTSSWVMESWRCLEPWTVTKILVKRTHAMRFKRAWS